MSYDVTLLNAGPVKRIQEGGTQLVGGSTEPSLNITYNYARVYHIFDFSLRDLHGKHGKPAHTTIPQLTRLVQALGTDQYHDYWAPTPGNAGHALAILLGWAREYPEGIWDVC